MDDAYGMEVNYDILSLVSQLLARLHRFRDVSSMAQTCRFLHVECASLLLTPRHIRVVSRERIESFCRFMLADKHRRFPLLSHCHTSLLLSTGQALAEPIADILIETLGNITALRYLCFLGFEYLMLSSPRILPALAASLTWVDRLEVDSLASNGRDKRVYAKFLKTLQAPRLNAIKLLLPWSGGNWRQHITYDRELDPRWLLSSFSSTLESIVLVGAVTVAPSSFTYVYPRLTHLMVPRFSMPFVYPYISAFPFLRVLRFDYSGVQWGIASLLTQSIFTYTLRDKSSEELRMHNREDQAAHGSWGALEDFMGMTLDAYMAGLTCRISKLHLIAWGGIMEAEVSAICAMFADARPSVFRLALRPTHTDYIAALFYDRVELFSSLSSLELRLDVAVVPFDFKTYLDNVGPALQRLPIVSLQVEIKCLAHIAIRKTIDPPYCDSEKHCYTLTAMSSEDVQARLRSLLDQVPTLRRVTIAWGRCTVRIPHRLITIDLDNVPHTTDRPGRYTDQYWRCGYQNTN